MKLKTLTQFEQKDPCECGGNCGCGGKSVNEKFNFSKKEVEAAANLIASAISQADKVKAKVHDLEYDKGRGAGFEISIDGEKYEGGSYVVKDNGDVVNAAIGNSHPNAVYNTIGNKDIADVFINMEKYESVTEAKEEPIVALLKLGLFATKGTGEKKLLRLSDDFEEIGDEQADEIASHLNMAIELFQDGYSKAAVPHFKKFNKACKDELALMKKQGLAESVTEVKRSMVSGTSARTTSSLEDRKYELKKDVEGAKIGDFINVTLPKGTIIYNLPGGVFADHFSLKNKYASKSSRGPQYFDKPTFKGIQIISKHDTLAAIEDNSKVLESVVAEAKKYKFNDLAKAWQYVYGEDMEDEYEGFYQEVVGKYKNKVTKADIATIWSHVYGEEIADDYDSFYNELKENLEQVTKLEKLDNLNEQNADGTISDDEDDRLDDLLGDVEMQIDELIQHAKTQAYEIGGDFRGPGMTSQLKKLMLDKLKRMKN